MEVLIERTTITRKNVTEFTYEFAELTPELIEQLTNECKSISSKYENYVLSIKREHNNIILYFNGPWEC